MSIKFLDESCSLVSISNATQVFKECGILRQESTTGCLVLKANENDILDIVARINKYN